MARGSRVSFHVTILGSSGMFATAERACSGYLLEPGGAAIWVDAGAGTWQQLLRHTDYRTLAGIILSHRHPDHTTDVFQCYHARQYGGPKPLDPLALWTTEETMERLVAFSKECGDAFDFRTVEAGREIEVAGANVSFHAMAHPPETLGVRIEYEGAVLAYSSDTGPNADFRALAGGANVFICEATYQNSDGGWEGHLSAADAGRIASDLGCERLVLTHLPPGRDHSRSLEEATETAAGVEVLLAEDGMRIEVRR